MSEERIRTELRRWITERAGADKASALSDDTLLLEQGLLTSLDVVELVLFLESLKGAEIDTEEIEPDVFRSVNTLYEAFFARA